MPARRRVDVRALRAAAVGAVERASLRSVARRMRISAQGLALFLDGATPREATLRKLREWYFSEAATGTGLTAESARAVIDLFLESLVDRERPKVFRKVVEEIDAAHREQGTSPPPWLQTLRDGEAA